MMNMIQVMTIGSVALVVLAVVGCATAWLMSRLMDVANRKARERRNAFQVLPVIEGDPLAAGVYYGLRWVGICILVAWLFSRAV